MAGLQWFRLDTTFFDNGKIMALVDSNQHRAVVTHLSGMCHVGKTGTQGFIPEGALRRFGSTKADAHRLVEAGLWIPVPGGWNINDWADYQGFTEAAEARSRKASEAAKKRWHGNGGGDAQASG